MASADESPEQTVLLSPADPTVCLREEASPDTEDKPGVFQDAALRRAKRAAAAAAAAACAAALAVLLTRGLPPVRESPHAGAAPRSSPCSSRGACSSSRAPHAGAQPRGTDTIVSLSGFSCDAMPGWAASHWEQYCQYPKKPRVKKVFAMSGSCNAIWWALGSDAEDTALAKCSNGGAWETCYVYSADGERCPEEDTMGDFICKDAWPTARMEGDWVGYCNAQSPKAWAMTQPCNYAGWAIGSRAKEDAKKSCKVDGQPCGIFDVDGASCRDDEGKGLAPSDKGAPAFVHWGPPFEGAFDVMQGPLDCAPTHCRGGMNAYAVDWYMPKGTRLLAGRAGKVTYVVDGNPDGAPCWETGSIVQMHEANVVYIQAEDGTTDAYVHLDKGSIAVKEGDAVDQGQFVGLSGNSGCTDAPHLHVGTWSPDFTLSIPMRWTFPCGGHKVRNTTLKVGDFTCNDPTCECASQACTDFPGQYAPVWDNYCRNAAEWNAVWAMSKGCSKFGWGVDEAGVIDFCQTFGHECEVWDRAGAGCL